MTSPAVSEDENRIASIQLPSSLFEQVGGANTSIGLVFTLYLEPVLFPLADDTPSNSEIRTPVIGALLGGIPTVENLTQPVTIVLKLQTDEIVNFLTCGVQDIMHIIIVVFLG